MKRRRRRRLRIGGNVRRVVQVSSKAVRYTFGGDLDRIPCEMGVAGSCLDLSVTEELTDHWQALAKERALDA